MNKRTLIIILSPLIAIALLASIIVGVISLNLNTDAVARQLSISRETARLAVLLFSCLAVPFQIVFIALLFALAFMIHRRSWRIAGFLLGSRLLRGWVVRPSHVFTTPAAREKDPYELLSDDREHTVQQLIASLISLAAFSTATILSLAQFVRLSSLAVLITVITGGLAWGARTLISDLLSGISNIFEDNFDVGDKVEFIYAQQQLEGSIEKVTVRMAHLRAPTGELTIVPHGELRVLRNYSRGKFSGTTVSLLVNSSDMQQAVALLQDLAPATPTLLPEILEPWLVLNREGELGTHTEITLVGQAPHGQGAALRLKIMAMAVEKLKEAGISLGAEGAA